MNWILMLLGLMLMAVGAAQLIRWAIGRGAQGMLDSRTAVLVAPKGPDDCESLLRCAGVRLLRGTGCRFVCVAADPESREIALRLRERYRGLEVLAPGDLEKLLTQGGESRVGGIGSAE